MRQPFRFVMAACAATLALAVSAGAAPVIYVNAATGNDANPGDNAGSPVATIAQGITNVDAGGTVNIAAGTYNGAVVLSKQVNLRGANADVSPITGTRGAESVMTADAPVLDMQAGADGSIVNGIKFTGSANDVDFGIIRAWLTSVNNVEVVCNLLDANASRGICVASVSGWNVHDNLIQNVTGTQESALYLVTMQASVVAYNKIVNSAYAGMIIDSSQNLLISHNTIQNTPQPGIQVGNTVGPVTVADNTISQANTSNGADKGAIAIYVNVTNLTVTGNTLTNNNGAVAVRNQAGAIDPTVLVNQNNIVGNTGLAVRNLAQGGGMLDATNNWWGSATGPTNAANPSGTGDSASTNVNFAPWLSGLADVADWCMY